jgi:uncharacterized protein YdeI (BOF family)
MAQIIKIKRSTTTASPTTLTNGELAYSAVTGGNHKLFIGRPGGGTGDIDAIGGKYFTDIIDAASSSNVNGTLVLRDASGNFSANTITATSFVGALSGNATTATTVNAAAQPAITSLGTLTALTVDNFNLDSNTFSSLSGNININPVAGSSIVLDGTINIDGGVVTGATSITSTSFVGALSGNATTATTVNAAAQPAITSLGTLTALTVDNLNLDANTFSSLSGNINIAPVAGSSIVLDGTINIDAGVVTGATSISSTALTVENFNFSNNIFSSTSGDININPVAGSSIVLDGTIDIDAGVVTGATSITSTSFVGELTGNASTATILQTARNFSISGDASAPAISFNGSGAVALNLTLANTGVTANSYGSSTSIPVITVDAKGRVTSLSTQAISSSFTISDGANTDVFNNGGTLTFTGGTGVTTLVSDDTVAISIGQAVATTSNVTFNDVNVNGTLTSNDITSTNISIAGNATITGNLIVQGTTTSVESTTVTIDDPVIALADNTTSVVSDGLDRGVRFKYGNGTSVLTGFFGLDIQTQRFVFQNNQTAATDDFSTPWGDVEFGNVYSTGANIGNISVAVADDQTITTTSGNLVLDAVSNIVQIQAATQIDSLTLTTDLAVADGGTGHSTFTSNGVIYGNAGNGLLVTVAGAWDATHSTGEFLSVNSAGVPTWTNTLDGGTY